MTCRRSITRLTRRRDRRDGLDRRHERWASQPIDRTLIERTDEFGKASLVATIPEGAAGSAPYDGDDGPRWWSRPRPAPSSTLSIPVFERAPATGTTQREQGHGQGEAEGADHGCDRLRGRPVADWRGAGPRRNDRRRCRHPGCRRIAVASAWSSKDSTVGQHTLTVHYVGNDTVEPWTSDPIEVTVR